MTDTTPEPSEARIPIDDAREQLLDLLEETATATYDADAGVIYVVSDDIQDDLTAWRGYRVVRYVPDPTGYVPATRYGSVEVDASQVTGNEGFIDTDSDERPDVDEATPETEKDSNWVTNLDDAEPKPFDADGFADPDMTDEERDAFLAALEEDKRKARPRVIYSTIDDGLGNEQVVGWDTCGKCLMHIRICECDGGPHRPSYVEKFAFQPVPERNIYEPGGDMVEGTMHAGVLTSENDDDMVITRVEPDVSPSGRRKRKDAGKPRKPRDAQATQAAAEDLAAAIKDRSNDG